MRKLLLSLILISCGSEQNPTVSQNPTEESGPKSRGDNGPTTSIEKEKENKKMDTKVISDRQLSLALKSKSELPECGTDNENQLVYVKDTKEFFSCELGTWATIEMPETKDGTSGVDGKDGTNGQDGIAGTNGLNGEAGQDALTVNALNPDGSILGRFLGLNTATNEYYVIDGKNRYQITKSSGALPNAYLVFAGLDCTGESRLVMQNGMFSNVFIDGRDNTTAWKMKGQNLGSFTRLSRIPAANSCQNESGLSTNSYQYEQIILPRYPLTGVDIKN